MHLQRSPEEAKEEAKAAKAKVEAKERKEVRVEVRERHSKEDVGAEGARTSTRLPLRQGHVPNPRGLEVLVPGPAGLPATP